MNKISLLLTVCALVLLLGFPHNSYAETQVNENNNIEKSSKDNAKAKKVMKKKGIMDKCIGLVNMSNGIVLPKGKFVTNIKYRYVHKDSLYDGSHKMNGNYGGKYSRINQSVQLTAKAGLFKNFEARVMVPFWDKVVKRKPGNLAQPWDKDTVSGLGDMVFMGRYALMTQREGDWLSFSIGAGVKCPTGDADHENDQPFSKMYEYLGPSAQLGTGSWDPKFEIGATKMFGRSRVDAHMMYTLGGEGAHHSRKGNQLNYDLGYGYSLNQYFDLELELNGVDQDRDIHAGSIDDSTGGHTIFITPGVHWKITDRLNLAVGVPVVVYRDLNGYSSTPDANSRYGLGEDFQVVTRLGFCF
ncbi:transporter [Desulfovibrio sp. UCD-KL4C]|uniref:transporter n=1 Tax=Desulfovibrio sp. UCD-KL4C TaxID=2578120 RepID=UPI0025C2E4A6|nr:transporter [Desulfovibrio sp. UCD-KL4C]